MKQFLTSYGPFILMMLICVGSHLFMHHKENAPIIMQRMLRRAIREIRPKGPN